MIFWARASSMPGRVSRSPSEAVLRFRGFFFFKPSATPLAAAVTSLTAVLVALAASFRIWSGVGLDVVVVQPARPRRANAMPKRKRFMLNFDAFLAACEEPKWGGISLAGRAHPFGAIVI